MQSKFGRNYKSVIYGSVKFYGIGPWSASKERGINPPYQTSAAMNLTLSKSYERSCGVNYDASLGVEGRALVVIYYHKLGH